MSRVRVTAPDGTPGSVDASEYESAVKAGYKPITEATEYANSWQGQVDTVLEGAGRGLTVGLSDTLGDQTQMRVNKEQNPVLAGAADLVGTIVGPGKVIGAAGKLVKGGGFLASTARLGLEGSLYGLEPAVSESILEDKPLTAELLASHMLGSALAGGAIGAGTYGLGRLSGAVAKAAGEITVSESLTNLAKKSQENVLAGHLGVEKDLAKWGVEQGIFAHSSHESVAHLADRVAKTAGENMGQAVDMLESVMPAAEVAKLPVNPIRGAVADALEPMLRAGPKQAMAKNYVAELESVLAQPDVTWQEVARLRTSWNKQLQGIPVDSLRREVANAADKSLRGAIVNGMRDKLPDTVAQGYRDAIENYAKASQIQEAAQAAMARGPEMGGYIAASAGAGLFGGPAAAIGTPLSMFAMNTARQRGGYLAASALGKIADSGFMPQLAKGLASRIEQVAAMAPDSLGPFGPAIMKAMGEGTASLLSTHASLAASPMGSDYLARLGLSPADTGQVANAGHRVATLSQIANGQAAFHAAVDKATTQFLRGSGEAPEFKSRSVKEFTTTLESLKKLIQDPRPMVDSGNMDHVPGLTVSAGAVAMQAAQFLLQKAPQDPNGWKPPSLRRPWEPAPSEVAKFFRYAEALSNPGLVAQHLAAGQVNHEGVEVMKQFYPETFARLQSQMMAKLMEAKGPIEYRQRLVLSGTFGPELLGLSPQQMLILQTAHKSNNPSKTPPPTSQDGRQVVNQGKNMQTQAQRLEARSSQ